MEYNTLTHTGVLGMKWGIHRAKKVTETKESKKITDTKSLKTPEKAKKSAKDMSDDEIKQVIGRLELEKRYKELLKADQVAETSKTKAFVASILEASGKNIATQVATYAMGTALNKVAGAEVVNPKKGQKDK